MRLQFDFANNDQATKYPCHGWASNTQGVDLLWLPILRALHNVQEIRNEKSCNDTITPPEFDHTLRFEDTVKKLVIVMTELSRLLEIIRSTPFGNPGETKELFAERIKAVQMAPLLLELTYVYVRRLSFDFSKASRPALFKYYTNVPEKDRTLPNLIKEVQSRTDLDSLEPICDLQLLEETLKEHLLWYYLVADKPVDSGSPSQKGVRKGKRNREGGRPGIRNRMEHGSVITQIQQYQIGEQPLDVAAFLLTVSGPAVDADLIATLKVITRDLCDFWTGICASIKFKDDYESWITPYGDVAPTGIADMHSTFFWPEI